MTEETTKFGDHVVHLKFVSVAEFYALDPRPYADITSVHVFPVEGDQVLMIRNQRGLDIIGGHVEPGESPIDALKREMKEEASALPCNMEAIGFIRIDNRDNDLPKTRGYPEVGYMQFFVSDHFKVLEFLPAFETTAREFVDIDQLPTLHHRWLETHNDLLAALKETISNSPFLTSQ